MWPNGINDWRGKKLKCENELKNPKLDWPKCFFAAVVITLICSFMSLFISGKYLFSLNKYKKIFMQNSPEQAILSRSTKIMRQSYFFLQNVQKKCIISIKVLDKPRVNLSGVYILMIYTDLTWNRSAEFDNGIGVGVHVQVN